MLCCMYIAYLVLLLDLCVFSSSYMSRSWEKSVLFKDAISERLYSIRDECGTLNK